MDAAAPSQHLHVLFRLGDDLCALDAREVVEILPLVKTRPLPRAPAGIAGLIDYRGTVLPVVDVSLLALGRPHAEFLSTRIVVVHYASGRLLGVIVEHATEMFRCAPDDFVPSGVTSDGARYLGPVKTDARGMIQRIEVAALLTPAVAAALFADADAAA